MADQSTAPEKANTAAENTPAVVYMTTTAVDYKGSIIAPHTLIDDADTIAYLTETGQIGKCLRTALNAKGGA